MIVQLLVIGLMLGANGEIVDDRPAESETVVEVPQPPSPPPAAPPRDGGLSTMGLGGNKGGPGYAATWYPNVATNGSDFGLLRQSLSLAAPLWMDGDHSVFASAGVRNASFFTDIRLPDSDRAFPAELWNVSLGVTYVREVDDCSIAPERSHRSIRAFCFN